MVKQSFAGGAFILTAASILSRVLGFCYQIIIIRIIGAEGIGVFNMVYPLYSAAIVLSTAGIPSAVSKYTAEAPYGQDADSAGKILSTAVFALLLLSTCEAFLLIASSPFLLPRVCRDTRVIPAFLILIPTIVLIAVSSAVRGYFQGSQDMRPTAYTQLVEQIIRLTSGILLVYFLGPHGLTLAVAGLSAAIFLSEVGGLLYLLTLYRRTAWQSRLLQKPSFRILKKLISFGAPIAATRIGLTLITAFEANLIPAQIMKAGHTLSQAASFYGELTGVAFTLLMLPSTFSFSLATSLLPAVSEALSKNQRALLGKRASDAIGLIILLGVPWAILLFFCGPGYASLLFKVSKAGELLQILALGSVFLYLSQTTAGILQGIGCVKTNFVTSFTGGLLKLSLIYSLGHHRLYGAGAIAASYVAGFVTVALLNLAVIRIKTGFTLEKGFLPRLFISSLALVTLLTWASPAALNDPLSLGAASAATGFLFFIFMLAARDKYCAVLLNQLLKAWKRSVSAFKMRPPC